MSNWVGQTLGKVRIDTLLARGGTAEVYVGTHTTLQREVAIKVLHRNYDEHPHALERFQREAMVVAKLRHPNIVQVFDFDTTTDSHPYLVMEYIKGPSLLKYLNSLHSKGKQLDFPHVIRLMNAMTNALQYAHDSGVIHRDIKPGNILLTSRSSEVMPGKALPDDFEPVLTDFGLVRFLDSTQHTTGSGQIAGTPAYMSPEQARGDLTDGRTDVYSLGIVLYEILAGHLPFEAETTMGVLMKHISEPPAPIPGLPPTLQFVLDRALAKNLDERFQTPAEFGQAFLAAVETRNDYSTLEMPGSPPITRKPAKKIFVQQKNRRWVAPTLAAVAVVALAGSVLMRDVLSPALPTVTLTTAIEATDAPPSPATTSTSTRTPVPALLLGRPGVLQFRNNSGIADEALLTADALLSPPEDRQYEVWLVKGNQRLSLGILTVDANGKGQLTFEDSQGTNLLSTYDSVEITVEPSPDNSAGTSGIVAYSFKMPAEGLTHVRYLLVSFPSTPNNTALIQGLYTDISMIHELAQQLQEAQNAGDEDLVREQAEQIYNLIVGEGSPSYKDHNNDGTIDDPSDGFGLLLNGRNLGYLPAVFTEADSAVKSAGASEPMRTHGAELIASVQNLAQWTPELQIAVTALLNSAPGSDVREHVVEIMSLAEKLLNGVDADEDGRIDAETGEGGALVAYQQAYRMADMPLDPVGILNTGTGTPSFLNIPMTSTPIGGGSSGPTQHVPPGQQNRPTPRNNDNNGNNGGSNGNNP